jgi:hypothetical protein
MSWAPTEEEFKERVAEHNRTSRRSKANGKVRDWLDGCIKGVSVAVAAGLFIFRNANAQRIANTKPPDKPPWISG